MTDADQGRDSGTHSSTTNPTSGPHAGLWGWIDRRTGADALLRGLLYEPIPGGARFAYVFGAGLLFLFLSQIITGVCLAVYYVPSPLTAHVTLAYIIKEVAGGAFLRSLHSYGSSAMVVVLMLHFLQTFLFGSYKGRRELLWISGCVLSLLVLGLTFTGYLLRWDLSAYFAGSVGTNIAGNVPLIGSWLLRLVRGGEMMGALTLSRFYVLHVFVLPAGVFLFVAVHIFMFRQAGPAGPVIEDPVQPRLVTETFYPQQVIFDMAFVLVVMGVLGMLAHFVPVPLGPEADPTNSTYLPRPEWYYLPFFEWLKFWDGAKTVIGVVVIPTVLIALFFLIPFLDRGRERRPWKRPIPVGSVLIVLIGLIWLGMQSRLDDARDPTTAAQITRQDAAEAQYLSAPFQPFSTSPIPGQTTSVALSAVAEQGKTIFVSRSCSACHGAGGVGGGIGPALTHVSDKFPPAQLAALLKDPSAKMRAGGMAPQTLSATEMTALVSYLGSVGGGSPAPASAPARASPPSTGADAAPIVPSAPSGARVGISAPGAQANVTNPAATAGGKVYQSDGCAACHGEGGKGTQRAPALAGIGNKLSAVQVTALLHNPTAAMTAGGMPHVAGSASEIAALVGYLRSLKSTGAVSQQAGNSRVAAAAKQTQPAIPPTQPATPTPKAVAAESVHPPIQPPTGAGNAATAGQPANSSNAKGEEFFTARGCAACHGVGGVGTKMAPALAKFAATISPAALTSLLQNPNQKMRAGGMPATNMNAADMSALVAYLQHLGSPRTEPPAARASSAGAPAAGVPQPGSNQTGVGASQPPLDQLAVQGKAIFKAHSCATCHGMEGVGGTWAAPALANTGKNFPPALLTTLLQHPTARMKMGGMPPLSLSPSELKALVTYVSAISAAKPALKPVPK